MSKRQPKAKAAVPVSAPPKRAPTPGEAAAMAKAAAYCQTRTEPLAYKVDRIEGRNVVVEPPHNEVAGFVALQSATFGTASNDFASRPPPRRSTSFGLGASRCRRKIR